MLRKLFLFTIVAMNVTSNVACSDISGDANNGSAANSVTVATLQLLDAEKTVGHVEIYDDAALKFIDLTTKVSIRGEGYAWLEGPVWIEDGQYLLFSDIPNNLIAKYQPNVGTSVYLEKSGATGLYPGDYDAGSNGLLLNSAGQLVLLQQGDRRVAVMDAPLDSPTSRFKTLTEKNFLLLLCNFYGLLILNVLACNCCATYYYNSSFFFIRSFRHRTNSLSRRKFEKSGPHSFYQVRDYFG